MSKKIKIIKDYYDDYVIYSKDSVTINTGFTMLCGCNGSGKSTLLHQIQEYLKENKIPVYTYDDTTEGGLNASNAMLYYGDIDMLTYNMMSSEGESRLNNLGRHLGSMKHFIETGLIKNMYKTTFGHDDSEISSNERWILIDATTSGLSIDVINEIIDIFNLMKEDAKKSNADLYIVVAANEYEVTQHADYCIDVQNLQNVKFETYDEYKKFILESRKQKDNRIKLDNE